MSFFTTLKKYWILVAIPFIIFWLIGDLICTRIKFNNEGVYVIGIVDSVRGRAKGSSVIEVHYFYQGKRYDVGFSPGPFAKVSSNDRVFMKILKSDPRWFEFTEGVAVGTCYYDEKFMHKAWDEAPYCSYYSK